MRTNWFTLRAAYYATMPHHGILTCNACWRQAFEHCNFASYDPELFPGTRASQLSIDTCRTTIQILRCSQMSETRRANWVGLLTLVARWAAGLIYRMVKPKVVLLIFVSGKLVITGAFNVLCLLSECLSFCTEHTPSWLALGCLFVVGAKNREQIYSAFENIYPVTQKFRKVAEPVERNTAN